MIRKYFFCFCFTRDAKKKSDFDAFYEKKSLLDFLLPLLLLLVLVLLLLLLPLLLLLLLLLLPFHCRSV